MHTHTHTVPPQIYRCICICEIIHDIHDINKVIKCGGAPNPARFSIDDFSCFNGITENLFSIDLCLVPYVCGMCEMLTFSCIWKKGFCRRLACEVFQSSTQIFRSNSIRCRNPMALVCLLVLCGMLVSAQYQTLLQAVIKYTNHFRFLLDGVRVERFGLYTSFTFDRICIIWSE